MEKDNLGDINYPAFHKRLEETVFIVQEVLSSKKSYKVYFKELYGYMKQGFEKPEVRKHPLRYKFSNDPAEQEKTMEIRHFIVNIILWSTFIRYDKVNEINSSQIFDCSDPTEDNLYGYINTHLITPYSNIIDSKIINRAIDKTIYQLSQIYYDFALIMGLSMDMEMFDELRNKYPEFKALLETKPAPGMQPKEIEDMLDEKLREYINIVIKDKTNYIRPFLVAGCGINKSQLSQLSIMGSLKPDIEGNVNPIPINSNFIYGGLDSISNFYIDGQAGCKPLILNKTIMGKSGYFSYKAMTLSSNYRISNTVEDCHSARPIKFFVASNKHLKRLHDRYYVSEEDGSLIKINGDKDKHLIGTTILLRDPTTCIAHDGICHVCYGDLYYTNNDPHFHAGRFAATKLTNPIGQGILSSKHMLKTQSDMIEFDPEFSRFFILDTNKIMLDNNSKEDFSKWSMVINEDDIYINDEITGVEDFNYSMEKFSVVNKKTGETIEFHEKHNRDLYLFSSMAQMVHGKKATDGVFTIPFSKIDAECAFATVNITNNELTAPLKNIIKLIDRKDHYDCNNLDELVNKLVQLTIDSNINVQEVHCAMLLKGLIRDKDDVLLPPDFSNPDKAEDYQMLTLSNALIYNPALCVSLSFDNVNKQLINPITYKKYKKSDYDIYFKEDIADDAEIYYDNKRRKKMEKKLKKLREKLK